MAEALRPPDPRALCDAAARRHRSLVVVELAARVLRRGGAAKAEVRPVAKDRWELAGTDRQRFSSGAAVSNVRRALAALRSSRILDQKMRLRCAVPASAVAAGDAEALRRVVRVAPTRSPRKHTRLVGLGCRGAARLAAAVVAASKTAVSDLPTSRRRRRGRARPAPRRRLHNRRPAAAAAPRAQSHTPARRAALDLPVRARPRGRDARAPRPRSAASSTSERRRAATPLPETPRDRARSHSRATSPSSRPSCGGATSRSGAGGPNRRPRPGAARSRSGPRLPKRRRSSDEREKRRSRRRPTRFWRRRGTRRRAPRGRAARAKLERPRLQTERSRRPHRSGLESNAPSQNASSTVRLRICI